MFIRRLPKFEYHAPISLGEALDHLSRHGDKAKVLAGGTDLLVSMKKREIVPEHLINLKGIQELKDIHYDQKRGLEIGGLVTLGELERSTIVREKFSALWDAANVMAAPQIRSLATIGGNLCSAVPSADTAPPLVALGTTVTLAGKDGERTLLVEDFFKGPEASVLNPDEILSHVSIPNPPENSASAYLKLMRRNAMDLALVGVAVSLMLDGRKRVCEEVRIALGAVAPTPIRALRAEQVLLNKEADEDLAMQAGKVAAQEARPISDIRASKEYRNGMVSVLTKRAVMTALKRIKKNSSNRG
ncbi:MAG: xanthine dehydrogenase family protein subunit M [Desulfobacteraceae bacterium]|jgi:carbon-monoxide dehydrogenase medium subunit